MKTHTLIIILLSCSCLLLNAQESLKPYQDPSKPVDERVDDLIARLTLNEKVKMMKHESPAIPRLGIPAYDWWNEALHGVARTSEKVTVYPQAIGMAATFDTEAVRKMGDYTASEGRALFNEDLKAGKTGTRYRGLTYWTPNINIFRDPRWGRGQETYGEDPYLTGMMGSAIVEGLEGDDPFYLKAVAAAKHFAVHSGPEYNRHSFDARSNLYDLWDTYLPAFHQLVVQAKVHGIMCAYNRYEGQPCCGNDELLTNILRNQWGFDGYVTSDCWGVSDFTSYHKTHANDIEAAIDAVLSGTDLECGNTYHLLEQAVNLGFISEKDINVSLRRLLTILYKLGFFDPQVKNPYSEISRDVLECKEHKQHAYEMAQKSIVLLKNDNQILPLDKKEIKKIALIGPNADNPQTQLANYFGEPTENITPLMSLKNRFKDKIEVQYFKGVNIMSHIEGAPSPAQLTTKVADADVIVFVGGISADYEGEAGDAGADGYGAFVSGDRSTIALPKVQTDLMKELKKTGKPLVLVNMSGSIMSFEWESQHANAIVQAWYGGQASGDAIVDVLFGDYNPAGRMPLTTYISEEDLPPFEDYSMANRTYRYFNGEVRYPFGHGLSYTTFEYSKPKSPTLIHTGETISVETTVKNTGARDGDEVVQLYIIHPKNGNRPVPNCALKGFKRISLKKGESKTISFVLTPKELSMTDEKGNLIHSAGDVQIYIGGGQPKHSVGEFVDLKMEGEPFVVY
ncbi:MAG: glycosyl hydrolase [Bacteroidales bacterium]|nr:glycosyl hydrolase [Bacteroidales bacterium]